MPMFSAFQMPSSQKLAKALQGSAGIQGGHCRPPDAGGQRHGAARAGAGGISPHAAHPRDRLHEARDADAQRERGRPFPLPAQAGVPARAHQGGAGRGAGA